jgi:uncharacterized damage-inducible protein DinB
MKRFTVLLTLALATPVLAQTATNAANETKPAKTAKTAKVPSNPGVSANRAVWELLSGYVLQSAEQMPDTAYAFRPTPEVRTFGQLIGHVAGAQYMMCAAALGEAEKAEDDIEKTKTSKADLVTALKASSDYCRRAYSQSDASASASTKLFGQTQTRMFALAINASHDGEHYGNIVTYFRIKGMVPPSSRPSTP